MSRPKSRSERLRSIEALSNREALDLAGQMERHARLLQEAEQRMQELTTYLEGYTEERITRSQNGGVSAMQLAETQLFLQRLEEAVRLQATVVKNARSGYEACRARWIAQHVRTSALGAAVHRFAEEEAKEMILGEQRNQDEIAARYHRPPEEEG